MRDLYLSRHPKGLAGLSQGFPMAASTCLPESTEPLTQVCQVRGGSCDTEDGATWTQRCVGTGFSSPNVPLMDWGRAHSPPHPPAPHFGPLTLFFLPFLHTTSLTRCTFLCLNQSALCEVGTPQLLTALSCCGQLCSSAQELGSHGAAERGVNPGYWLV